MATSSQALFELETLFIEKLQEKYKLNLRDIKRAFARFDLDHNGLLDLRELAGGVGMFLNGVKSEQLQELVRRYDSNGDGKISYEEFLHFLQTRYALVNFMKAFDRLITFISALPLILLNPNTRLRVTTPVLLQVAMLATANIL